MEEKHVITNHINITVGHALKRIREASGYTLQDVEDLTGYPAEKTHDIETGSKRINLHTFFRLVATFGGRVVLDGPNYRVPLDEYNIPPLTPSSQKIDEDEDTPPVKKRRPRLDPSQSKNL